jgi:hypothetical protein
VSSGSRRRWLQITSELGLPSFGHPICRDEIAGKTSRWLALTICPMFETQHFGQKAAHRLAFPLDWHAVVERKGKLPVGVEACCWSWKGRQKIQSQSKANQTKTLLSSALTMPHASY